MTGHVTSEALSAFLDGESTGAEGPAIAFHLASCPACRARLESTRRLVRDLGRMTPVAPPADLERRVRASIAADPAASRTLASLPQAPAPRVRPWAVAPRAAGENQASAPRRSAPFAGAGAGPTAAAPASRGARRSGWRAAARALLAHLAPPRFAGPLRLAGAPLGVGLACLLTVVVLQYGGAGGTGGMGALSPAAAPRAAAGSPAGRPEFRVSEFFGDVPAVPPQTTSQVAGRTFVLSDDVWVQRGLDAAEAAQPHALVNVRSPQGRRLLARYADLGVLLADGSRVVLRDHLQTLELSGDSSQL